MNTAAYRRQRYRSKGWRAEDYTFPEGAVLTVLRDEEPIANFKIDRAKLENVQHRVLSQRAKAKIQYTAYITLPSKINLPL